MDRVLTQIAKAALELQDLACHCLVQKIKRLALRHPVIRVGFPDQLDAGLKIGHIRLKSGETDPLTLALVEFGGGVVLVHNARYLCTDTTETGGVFRIVENMI
ncbi:hypothetical protein [uncultured Thiocystis sp.]|uniref:hypothetical protein n=1 Tax=uncultured Thiocystis sp. TaxID=1202134 RepID=UPI0025CF332D|nr:hypothetical protein [uncultured Thiocystis sp.]